MPVTVAYQTLLLKRSNVAAHAPQTTDLQLGEMAMNTNDGRLFMKKNNGTGDTVVEIVTLPYLNTVIGGTNVQFSSLQGTPTTLHGYGITDGASKGSVTTDLIGGSTSITQSISKLTGANYGVATVNTSTGPAIITFNQNNVYGAYFGLDTNNVLSYGGWSAGAASYPVFHGGNPQLVATTQANTDNSNNIATTAFVKNQGYATLAQAAVPGQIAFFAMATPGTGWLAANGAALSRTAYAALFASIGTLYGAGDGSTTFNIPDLRGVFLRGYDNGRGLDPSRVFGSYQVDMFASHTHTYDWRAATQPQSGSATQCWWQDSTQNTGATGGSETRPKNYAMLACIKY